MTEPVAHYRAPLWSRLEDVDRTAAVAWALSEELCGVGGRLDAAPRDLDDAVEQVARTWDIRLAARLRRFARVPDGTRVWTRDGDGFFHLGLLRGPWRHDPRRKAHEHDLTHVRDCAWGAGPTDPPTAVVAAFARGGRNFQRVHGAGGHPERG